MELNKDVLRLWSAALRSGEYKQTFHVSYFGHHDKPEMFCALGVLDDLAITVGVATGPRSKFGMDAATCRWLGVDETMVSPIISEVFNMNDGERKSFNQIANAIDTYL